MNNPRITDPGRVYYDVGPFYETPQSLQHVTIPHGDWYQTTLKGLNHYPMRLNRYLGDRITSLKDPLAKQFLPDPAEKVPGVAWNYCDWESAQSPTPVLVHRYPDRVLFKVSDQCAAFCRYCFRKPFLTPSPKGHKPDMRSAVDEALAFIEQTRTIQEVILSGGDPLMLTDVFLAEILQRLQAIPHVRIYRIHTRIPGVMPQRVTPALTEVLRKVTPLYIMVQFNHPSELTPEALTACKQLHKNGAILGSQTVLLRGVNDHPPTLIRLMQTLVSNSIRPYYLHQLDRVMGTGHFHVPLKRGIKIMTELHRSLSGLALPAYMLELPEGGGKIQLHEKTQISRTEQGVRVGHPFGTWVEIPL